MFARKNTLFIDSPKIRSMVQVSTAPNVEAKYNLSQNPCFPLLLDPLKGFGVVLENDLDDIFEFDFTYLMNYHDISILSQISRVFLSFFIYRFLISTFTISSSHIVFIFFLYNLKFHNKKIASTAISSTRHCLYFRPPLGRRY